MSQTLALNFRSRRLTVARARDTGARTPGAPMPEFLPEQFRADVDAWMAATGYSLDSLAHYTGWSRRSIEYWGDGSVVAPPGPGLAAVAWVLGLDQGRWYRLPKHRP